jgi:glycosyltransferase involved in cell wall biosynthesis
MDGLEWKRTKYNWLTKRFLKWAESLAAKNADVLVADSPAIQKHILERFNKISTFIPYGASIFTNPGAGVLNKYHLKPEEYFMLMARMEPENNIEMILKGWLASKQIYPLILIGDISNRYGKHLSSRYRNPKIIFAGSVYEIELLNNLRYYSYIYFHGHSVGGTNPSLLEAMACGCTIAAHDNVFNKAVLQNDADYFSTASDVAAFMNMSPDNSIREQRRTKNLERIKSVYNPEKIMDEYEQLLLRVCKRDELNSNR